jgi:hypothetical protein
MSHVNVDLAELSKYFMEQSDHDKIPLCKILYLVGGTEILAVRKILGMHNTSENGRGARVALRYQPTPLN